MVRVKKSQVVKDGKVTILEDGVNPITNEVEKPEDVPEPISTDASGGAYYKLSDVLQGKVILDKKKRVKPLNLNMLAKLEDAFECEMSDLDKYLGNAKNLRKFFFIILVEEDELLTEHAVGEMITMESMMSLTSMAQGLMTPAGNSQSEKMNPA